MSTCPSIPKSCPSSGLPLLLPVALLSGFFPLPLSDPLSLSLSRVYCKMTAPAFGDAPGCNQPLLLYAEACRWVFGGTHRLQSTSPWRSLLLGFRGHPLAAIDLFVAKLAVGFLEATPRLQSTSSWRSLLLGFREHPPAAVNFFVGEACCWVFRSPPPAAVDLFVAKLVVGISVQPPGHPPGCNRLLCGEACCWVFGGTALLQSTSSWRSLLLGFREHPRLQSTSPWRSLLLGFRGHPLAAIDLFVAKLVVGCSGAPAGCSRLLHGEACCWDFRGTPPLQSTSPWRSMLLGFREHPPAAIDFSVAKLVVGCSGAPPRLQSTFSW